MMTTIKINKLSELDWECVNENTTYLTHNIHPYHSKYIPQQELSMKQEAITSAGAKL